MWPQTTARGCFSSIRFLNNSEPACKLSFTASHFVSFGGLWEIIIKLSHSLLPWISDSEVFKILKSEWTFCDTSSKKEETYFDIFNTCAKSKISSTLSELKAFSKIKIKASSLACLLVIMHLA